MSGLFDGEQLELALDVPVRHRIPVGYQLVPDDVVQAVLLWSYCPMEGSYQDGPSIEDTCEILAEAVQNWKKVEPPQDWWTVEEMQAALNNKNKGDENVV